MHVFLCHLHSVITDHEMDCCKMRCQCRLQQLVRALFRMINMISASLSEHDCVREQTRHPMWGLECGSIGSSHISQVRYICSSIILRMLRWDPATRQQIWKTI